MPDSARFTIAIVCALPLEYDALVAVLDSSPRILPHATDQFLYTTGRFATHEVVIAYPEEYGPRDAALAIQFLEHKYGSMELIILLGICVGIPVPPERGNPIYLGDVVISTAVLAYAHGARKNPAGLEFREIFPKKARGKIRQIHRLLSTEYFLGDLVKRSREGLAQVGNMKARYMLLPANEDLFFDSAYHHLHRSNCPENKCDAFAPHICQIAEKQSCAELQCDLQHLYRCRPSFEITPVEIHTGVFASADTVMRDPQVRDDLAREHKVLAFDMEATGIWDLNPHVVVIKGVCDYGDSHKSKQWQDLAAAHAACVAKALVTTFFPKDEGKWEGIDTQHQHTFKRRETNVSDEIGQTTSQSLCKSGIPFHHATQS
ncbi:nucleoside phosphorylase domain-containing protein [Dendryphion nanum]|uniref:Nucleoside phosphorylase domain-containing protein n=1 Tax=Dendryphion nanum TaxID=256645 RepID=A0A9P9IF94_9PLEO|nr:nucleoside phosphorylase domain-containing protein [Dendryphion nanum]